MSRIAEWKKSIEKRLEEVFEVEDIPKLRDAMAYYLFQEGKRIRPLFVVAVSSALGGEERDAVTVGCVIEMIHNYSLIHDDLPAMDDDDLRRGLPTCHVKFGEAIAILAGDALLNLAFEVLSKIDNFYTLSSDQVIDLIRIISTKAGAGGMVGGQALDIGEEEDLHRINLKKTAALFEACFMCGGVIAGRTDLISDLEELGRKVGLLFQLVDDMIDKDGYLSLLGEERCREMAKELYQDIKDSMKVLGEPPELEDLLEIIVKRVSLL